MLVFTCSGLCCCVSGLFWSSITLCPGSPVIPPHKTGVPAFPFISPSSRRCTTVSWNSCRGAHALILLRFSWWAGNAWGFCAWERQTHFWNEVWRWNIIINVKTELSIIMWVIWFIRSCERLWSSPARLKETLELKYIRNEQQNGTFMIQHWTDKLDKQRLTVV